MYELKKKKKKEKNGEWVHNKRKRKKMWNLIPKDSYNSRKFSSSIRYEIKSEKSAQNFLRYCRFLLDRLTIKLSNCFIIQFSFLSTRNKKSPTGFDEVFFMDR